MVRFAYFVVVMISVSFCCCNRSRNVVQQIYYSDGNIKSIEYFEGNDTFPLTVVDYYSNGCIKSIGLINRKSNYVGLCKTYYPDGRLADSCEYYNGLCIRQLCNDFPKVENCYIMSDGESNKLYTTGLRSVAPKYRIDFSIYLDGLPHNSCKMYYKYADSTSYHTIYMNEDNPNFPFTIFTGSKRDTMSVYCMFPNDSSQIIIGKTPQLKFNFIVE